MSDKLLKSVGDELAKHFNDPIDIKCSYCEAAKAVIPLVRADTLKSISKEATKLDGTTYSVPDYSKFRDAIKEGE